MPAKDRPARDSQAVERTDLAVVHEVHEDERIVATAGAAGTLLTSPAQVVNYHFPVEVEILGVGALAERIYDALRRELNSWG
jgi:hypothetical protein